VLRKKIHLRNISNEINGFMPPMKTNFQLASPLLKRTCQLQPLTDGFGVQPAKLAGGSSAPGRRLVWTQCSLK
jgi:hypothetical protein